ncbi:hypothetical protein GGR51DRAFT_560022 [Nemania sp. FL0031]|nr:hypothetical protein GGR51DRAFT_560022 [Nemania sp. FL0031]
MANNPGARALRLTNYFISEHEFEPESYHGTIILYKRTNRQNAVERIVVKHAEVNENFNRDDEILSEERILRRLWGAEHIMRLLSIVRNRSHRSLWWNQPFSRPAHALSRILPWKLTVDPIEYPEITRFNWFVMEHLARGDGNELRGRCRAQNIDEISEPLLWYFFLCRKTLQLSYPSTALTKSPVVRGCIAMAWPPNSRNMYAPPVTRERPGRKRHAEGICHHDLHLGNIMFGEYDANDNAQPSCHQGVPIIDFGLSDDLVPEVEAHEQNIFQAGELIYQLATVDKYYPIYNDDDRPTFDVDDIENVDEFPTYLDEDFYRSEQYSVDLRRLLARCLAVDGNARPALGSALRICGRKVAETPNWRHLADEVTELFDIVPSTYGNDSDYDDDE